jgi:hypothetical protein
MSKNQNEEIGADDSHQIFRDEMPWQPIDRQ